MTYYILLHIILTYYCIFNGEKKKCIKKFLKCIKFSKIKEFLNSPTRNYLNEGGKNQDMSLERGITEFIASSHSTALPWNHTILNHQPRSNHTFTNRFQGGFKIFCWWKELRELKQKNWATRLHKIIPPPSVNLLWTPWSTFPTFNLSFSLLICTLVQSCYVLSCYVVSFYVLSC